MKQYKPTTPSRRFITTVNYRVLAKKDPEKRLTKRLTRRAGRSRQQGKITVRHRGGGSRKKYRVIDFTQDKFDIPARVLAIEYDPNRTCFIAFVCYRDGEKRYILAPEGLKAGDTVVSSVKTELVLGNRMPLKNIPIGTFVHNIELSPLRGGKIARSAGSAVQVISKDAGMVHVVMPSSEIRMLPEDSYASIGQLSNPEHRMEVVGKAGRSRWRGRRPRVRGSAMNPVDHPHGGGEGRAPIGLKHPKTPWGKPALGVKTRKRHKYSDKFIVRRRKTNK